MKKLFKISGLFLGFIFLVILIFNYRVYGNFSFNKNNLDLYKDNSEIESVAYNSMDIYYNQKGGCYLKTFDDVNACNFNLSFDLEEEEIYTLVIELDGDKINSNQVWIDVFTNNNKITYGVNNFYINKYNQKMIVVNEKMIDKIELYVEGDVDKEKNFRDIFNIKEIRINDSKDINELKISIIYELVISVIWVILLYLFIFLLFKSKIDKKILDKKIKIEKLFLIIGLISGVMFSLLFPLYQIPDELTHINMIYEDLGVDIDFSEVTNNFGDTKKISGHYNAKVDLKKYFDLSEKIEIRNNFKVSNKRIISHLPQAIGIILGTTLKAPVLLTVTFSEVLACFFYVLVCYYALKLMPVKKEVFMMLMLLPICIQQIGTFSYDVIVNSISFLFIAYIFHLKFTKKEIVLFDLLKLISMLVVIYIVKLPYVVLAGILMLLPLKKLNVNLGFIKINERVIKKNYKKVLVFLLVFFIILLILMFKVFNTFHYGRLFIAAILGGFDTIKLFVNTFFLNYDTYLVQLVGSFGWHDIQVSVIFMVFVIMSILLFSLLNKNESEYKLKKWEIIYIYFINIVLLGMIFLSMFSWTLNIHNIENYLDLSVIEYVQLFKEIDVVEGVQGRYLIFNLVLFLIPLSSKFISSFINKFNYKFYLLVYYLVIIIYMFVVVLNRYWIR